MTTYTMVMDFSEFFDKSGQVIDSMWKYNITDWEVVNERMIIIYGKGWTQVIIIPDNAKMITFTEDEEEEM